jgi:hypothetical protein
VTRLRGAVVSITVIAAVLTPLARDPIGGDSFPLSTYPMFAFERRLRETFTYAVGRTASGERRAIEPGHVANHEVMQAYMEFTRTPRRELCPRIAARVAADADLRDVVRIEIVRATHDAVALLVRGERGVEKVLHTCEVPR